MVSRRGFLAMAAAGLLRIQKTPEDVAHLEMIVRSARPEDLEMPPSGFGDFITPIEHFFVRTHVSVPRVDIAQWRLKVEGDVATPLTLSIDDLRKMPSHELVSVLECAGNGRSMYDPPVAGLQWANGAAGNGRWRGVGLSDLLQRAGVKTGAVEILLDGADVPIGTMADFQRSIPIKKALHPGTLLAYSMNGDTLPIKHGFPLRAIVPGWAGDFWVKWVTSVRVLNEEYQGFWMKNAYLYPDKQVAPGTLVPPEAMSPVTRLRVKSVIAFPTNGARVEVGRRILVRGAAWSGDTGRVVSVDVSNDGGRSWRRTRLTGEATEFGWRMWEFPWTPPSDGHHTLLARARDSTGDVQPLVPDWNPSGYLWNAVTRVDFDAGQNSSSTAPDDASPAVSQPSGFRGTCLACHDEDVIRQQHLSRAQWDREINKMIGWGARVSAEDREMLLDYLAKLAGPRR